MTADRWTQVVRHQLGLGRLLPLGLPRDGAWITEEAAESVLRRAAAGVDGVRLGALRIALADPDRTGTPAVPPPPSALPPGPLRVTAEFLASADPTVPGVEPLPATAARLRLTLATAATQRLGLDVSGVDLRVTDLLEEDEAFTALPADGQREAPAAVPADAARNTRTAHAADGVPDTPATVPTTEAGVTQPADPADDARESSVVVPADDVRRAPVPKDPEQARIAAAALAVPGVTRLTGALGPPVHVETAPATEPALPRRHIRVELAVSPEERAVDVARAVRAAITEAARDTPSVAVLVTAVSQDARP
ncbi:nucleopolyhedrovirus P10 family protein [Streptomyces sp. NPDC006290]|uniref:nucleopolyhedrovirus P10 family protein n=1 Tax=Streptomyces sp. NPDC006290 TaxID=3156745 RepID=UPI0033A323CC